MKYKKNIDNIPKKISNLFSNNSIVVAVAIIITIYFTSIGYSAMATSFMVTGEANLRVSADIRITDIRMLGSTEGGYETYTPEYYKDGTKIFTTLPNIGSIVTYEVEITNFSDQAYLLKEIIEVLNSNENIEYIIEGITVGSEIAANDKVTFTIKVHYINGGSTPSDIASIIELNYEFEIPDKTPPVVTFSVPGGTYNTTKEVTVTASDSNFSYMNIQVNDGNGVVLEEKNITTNSYTVTLGYDSTWAIYVMAYDTAGNKQMTNPINEYGWTYQYYIIDSTGPTVTFSVTGGIYSATQSITITATDPNFSYMNVQVNDSNGVVLQQNNITTNSYTVTLEYESTWTVYVMAYDTAGNKQATAPLNQYGWTYQTYIIDWTAPTVAFSLTGGTYSGTQSITVTATDPNFSYMNIQVNDSNGMVSVEYSIQTNSYTVNLGYDSTWTVFVQAFDTAGHGQSTPPVNEYLWTYQTYVITPTCQRVSSCGCEVLGDWQKSGSSYVRTYDASTTSSRNKTVCTATSPTKTDYTCQDYVKYCLQYKCC